VIFPNFDPVLIHIGPLAIRWYALAYVTGILLGWRYAVRLTKNAKLWGGQTPTCTPLQIDDLVLWITLGIILGGRMGYVLFYDTALIWRDPLEIVKVWHGGMSFHGGLIGVIVAIVAFARSAKIDILKLGDLVAPAVPIGLGFGRIANFINGELWGRPTDVPWGVIFPAAGPYPRHPSQIYEALLEGLVLFVVLRLATHRFGWLQRRGGVAGLFLAGYGLIRISLENVREPDAFMPNFPLGLTMGMLLSLPMLAAGAWLIWRAYRETPVVTPPATVEAS
jgi:phosphatidylglycerol:prolipoprotein diacylglycerol transferase